MWFKIGNGIADDIFQEDLQYTSGLLIDQPGNSLDTTWLVRLCRIGYMGDPLDVVSQNLSMTLGVVGSMSFSSLSTTRHVWSAEEVRLNTTTSTVGVACRGCPALW